MKIHIQQYDSTKNCVRFDSQFGTAEAKWMGDLPDVGSDYYVEIAINKCLDPAVPRLGTTQHEEGGWIYLNLITGGISVTPQISGRQTSINLSSPPTVANSIVVGMFHTHPNLGPGWTPGPSPEDLRLDAQDGVPDIVVGSPFPPATTYYQSGPARRLHLGGNQGLPSSSGGVAPQAKKDSSHDER